MATIETITDQEILGVKGCDFFLNADNGIRTRFSSNKLRWFTYKTKGVEFSNKQKETRERVKYYADQFNGGESNRLGLKLLLYENPTKNQNEDIKLLLKCGAEVRYTKTQDYTRIMTQNGIVFLGYTEDDPKENVINSGIYYIGDPTDSFVIYWNKKFDDKFEKARKIVLDGDKIVYADKCLKGFIQRLKEVEPKDWDFWILSVLGGGIISTLFWFLKWFLKWFLT